MTSFFVALKLFLIWVIELSHGSNWAQVSGPRQQNIAINKFPSAAHPHWQPRYGHSVINAVNTSLLHDIGTVLLMGGDVYDADYKEAHTISNLLNYKWGGGYKNDVWQMSTAGIIPIFIFLYADNSLIIFTSLQIGK
jgi:hypothetical protein